MKTFADELFSNIDNLPSDDGFDAEHVAEWYMSGKLSAKDIVERYGVVQADMVIDDVMERWGVEAGEKLSDEVIDAL